ncbi:MAG: FecR family protein [Steroidobacteraceae bacterium]
MPHGQIPGPGAWRLSSFNDRGKRGAPPLPADSQLLADDDDPMAVDNTDNTKVLGTAPAKRAIRPRALRFVASVLLALVAGVVWYASAYDPDSYHTAIGGIKAVQLSDGSKITLNTNSAIHVALTATERRIDLARGEAFFEVAKDRTRPFVVCTDGKRIVAVGTKFSVFQESQAARVVVTEGQVRVEEAGTSAAGSATQVSAGSVAQAGPAGVLVKRASVADAEAYLSWRSGYIALRDAALSDAVAEFNRYNKKQLVIADPSLAGLRIGGNLRATSVDAFVRVLQQGFPVRAKEEGDRIVLTAR